ncbi:hypothetical protein [Yinghuangia seranimata]|uniref:hypothetical protein n=1 Tax=Yinghuangia seranimata TaxID=408067 RepID=UPI00248D26EA|nr:hypothetical protein [Yinghuangia seranimata]MDI2125137.1 hypothetical protein [Yinghuangia seranimata]
MIATPSTETTARATGVDDEFDRYRHVVAEIFERHHRGPDAGGRAACACGAEWPCRQELLAAELLDWI